MACHFFSVTAAQNRHYMNISDGLDSANRFTLGMDVTAATGKLCAATYNASNAHQALTTAITVNQWNHGAAVWTSTSNRTCANNGTKGSADTGIAVPSGLNHFNINGRMTDYTSGAGGAMGHAAIWLRALADVEVGFLGQVVGGVTGGGSPRYIKGLNNYWKLNTSTGTETDLGSAGNTLTITGTLGAPATNPNVGTFWTAAALGNQTWAVGTPISSVDTTTKFDDVQSPYTSALMILGSAVSTTTALTAGTAVRIIPLTSSAGFSAGGYLSIGVGAPTFILAVSGSNALVATDQTFAASDTVFTYSVSSQSIPGLTLSANLLSGTPTSGGSFTNLFIRATNTGLSTLIADSPLFNAAISSVAFTAGPSFNSATTTGYVLGYTAGSSGTVYAIAMRPGAPTPTAAQVRAGSPTGLVARFSKGCTATPDTITLTSLSFPKHDLYIMNTIGGTDSTVTAFLNQQKLPLAGRQYITFASLSPTSPFSVVSPTIASGDVLDVEIFTGPWAINVSSDGNIEIDSAGDTSRDLIHFNIYDVSVGDFYYSADSIVAVNDKIPVASSGSPERAFVFFLPKNQVANGFSLGGDAALVVDPEGDGVTFAESGSNLAPLGLSVTSAGDIVGTTVNANSITIVNLMVSDPYIGIAPISGTLVVGQVQIPDVRTFAQATGENLVALGYLNPTSVFIPSAQTPGTVVQMSPSPGDFVDPGTEIFLLIAMPADVPVPAGNTQSAGGGSGTHGLTAKDLEDIMAAEKSLEDTLRKEYRRVMGLEPPAPPIKPKPLPAPKPSQASMSTATAAQLAALRGEGDVGVAALNRIGK